jgi:hypothetical protein
MQTLKNLFRKLFKLLGLKHPSILNATYWDNQVYFQFLKSDRSSLPRSIIKEIKFDPVYSEKNSTNYNILDDQLPSGSVPHVSSDSNDSTLVLNWHCGRSGSKYTAYNYQTTWNGQKPSTYKPKSGIICAGDESNQTDNMVSPNKVNFFYTVWFTINYADGPGQYRLVLAQRGDGDHILKKLEAVYDLAHSGWEAHEGKIKGAVSELMEGVEKTVDAKSKNIWYVAVSGDYGAPPDVPPPPFGTKMLPVYIHSGDDSDAFNCKKPHMIFCDINGKNPISVYCPDGKDDHFTITLLNNPVV